MTRVEFAKEVIKRNFISNLCLFAMYGGIENHNYAPAIHAETIYKENGMWISEVPESCSYIVQGLTDEEFSDLDFFYRNLVLVYDAANKIENIESNEKLKSLFDEVLDRLRNVNDNLKELEIKEWKHL